jgi:Mg2+-importing ATPase
MGTHVVSGTARALVVHTGSQTEFGAISKRLRRIQPETEFERGIRRLGYLLLEVTLLLVMVIFGVNVALHKPVLDSFLFSLAIAVGLTPQLLPAIISINLAKGATIMARHSVIVKRLSAIENLGSMDVFCTDKTGTITTGRIVLHKALNLQGQDDAQVFRLAYLNALFEQGFNNPIDQCIHEVAQPDITGIRKLDEIPYDFIRKRLSVLVTGEAIPRPPADSSTATMRADSLTLITKGAFDNVLRVCRYASTTVAITAATPSPTATTQPASSDPTAPASGLVELSTVADRLQSLYADYSKQGLRVLGVAYKPMDANRVELRNEDEQEMILPASYCLPIRQNQGSPRPYRN